MTTLTRALAPSPGRLSPNQARNNVAAAAAKLQAALGAMFAADADQAARAAKNALMDERARSAVRAAQARERQHAVTMDRRWLGKFADALNEVASATRKAGGRLHADALGDLVDTLGKEVERIEKREANKP
jgi:type IV secretory pathway TrbL component